VAANDTTDGGEVTTPVSTFVVVVGTDGIGVVDKGMEVEDDDGGGGEGGGPIPTTPATIGTGGPMIRCVANPDEVIILPLAITLCCSN
jgi:hypothetical protein